MVDHCPPECQQDRKTFRTNIKELYDMSIPKWIRGVLVTVLGVLFVCIAFLFVYSVSTYFTKEEAKALKFNVQADLTAQITKGFEEVKEAIKNGE